MGGGGSLASPLRQRPRLRRGVPGRADGAVIESPNKIGSEHVLRADV